MPTDVAKPRDRTAVTLNVAWMSILLGLGIEVLLLITAALSGKSLQLKPILADSVQKISWSTIVCMGLALGAGVSKLRPAAMGLAGFIAAPLAFTIAKALHKGTTQILGLGAAAAAGPSPLLLASIKALEYGCLGVALERVGRRYRGAIAPALSGLVIGIVFGGTIIALVMNGAAKPLTGAELVARTINEVIFPVGCSLVLHSAQYAVKAVARPDD